MPLVPEQWIFTKLASGWSVGVTMDLESFAVLEAGNRELRVRREFLVWKRRGWASGTFSEALMTPKGLRAFGLDDLPTSPGQRRVQPHHYPQKPQS